MVRLWSGGGQVVVRWWSGCGQVVVRWWPCGGHVVAMWWSCAIIGSRGWWPGGGQVVVRCRAPSQVAVQLERDGPRPATPTSGHGVRVAARVGHRTVVAQLAKQPAEQRILILTPSLLVAAQVVLGSLELYSTSNGCAFESLRIHVSAGRHAPSTAHERRAARYEGSSLAAVCVCLCDWICAIASRQPPATREAVRPPPGAPAAGLAVVACRSANIPRGGRQTVVDLLNDLDDETS